MVIYLELDTSEIIRSRTVYSLITMISEVSGFADIFMVTASFLLSTLVTPYVLQANLTNSLFNQYSNGFSQVL